MVSMRPFDSSPTALTLAYTTLASHAGVLAKFSYLGALAVAVLSAWDSLLQIAESVASVRYMLKCYLLRAAFSFTPIPTIPNSCTLLCFFPSQLTPLK